jgi:hypothetical protein
MAKKDDESLFDDYEQIKSWLISRMGSIVNVQVKDDYEKEETARSMCRCIVDSEPMIHEKEAEIAMLTPGTYIVYKKMGLMSEIGTVGLVLEDDDELWFCPYGGGYRETAYEPILRRLTEEQALKYDILSESVSSAKQVLMNFKNQLIQESESRQLDVSKFPAGEMKTTDADLTDAEAEENKTSVSNYTCPHCGGPAFAGLNALECLACERKED